MEIRVFQNDFISYPI